jgi:prophage maintenance system killer protein
LLNAFSPAYASRLNATFVRPAASVVVNPNELQSALSRPLNVVAYTPEAAAPAYLASTLASGIIKGSYFCFFKLGQLTLSTTGHPFMDGNKRTGVLKTCT